jgi:precorrin-2/cobalt-factor-2 C20-methyltransferase
MATLYGVGVGPGDPDLLTLKAARLLASVPVVAYPANPQGESLALSIAGGHIGPQAQHLPMVMAFTVDRVSAQAAYDQGAQEIIAHLQAGRDVAVLCEGDPLLFGSFAYVLSRMPKGTAVEVIPGVSSLTACAAVAGRPLALGDQPLLCLPGTLPRDALDAALAGVEAVAVFKVGRHLPKVVAALTQAGLADHALCVIRAGQPEQRIVTLAEAQDQGLPYFAMILARRPGVAG